MAVVLVIDDEVPVRDVVRQVLEEAGHTVLEATNGKSGLWMFREMRPDLAVVDLFMPEKEGIETIRDMRTEDPAAKVIAMSGGGRHGVTALLEGMTELGATMTLAKPFQNDELLAAVDLALKS
jgi:DNA-binding response OmpR family regulator